VEQMCPHVWWERVTGASKGNFEKFLSFLVLLALSTGVRNKRNRAAKGVLGLGENPGLEGRGSRQRRAVPPRARTRAFLWVASAHGICREHPSLTGPFFVGLLIKLVYPTPFLAP
jgi:hypothetical protein